MNSNFYIGSVEHVRYQPVMHKFNYPVYFYGLNIDELSLLDRTVFLFGYNRRRPAAIHDTDYLDDRPGSIREKLLRMLGQKYPNTAVSSIFMITSARYLNYIFNPVTFYYCFDDQKQTSAMVAEVNNTFGERHVYVPEKPVSAETDEQGTLYRTPKAFHVSPFNNLEGEYEFYFPAPVNGIDIRIDLIREGNTAFSAKLRGSPVKLTSMNLLKMMIRHPIVPHLTKPRIFMEAARLYFAKHLKYHDKPEPVSPMTIRRNN